MSARVRAVSDWIRVPVSFPKGRESWGSPPSTSWMRWGTAAFPPLATAPIHTIMAQGLTRSLYWPTPDQPSWP